MKVTKMNFLDCNSVCCGPLRDMSAGSVVRVPPGFISAEPAYGVRFDERDGENEERHYVLWYCGVPERAQSRCATSRIDDLRDSNKVAVGCGLAVLEASFESCLELKTRHRLEAHKAPGLVAVSKAGLRLVAPSMDPFGPAYFAVDPLSWTADPDFDERSISDWLTDWRVVVGPPSQRTLVMGPDALGQEMAA